MFAGKGGRGGGGANYEYSKKTCSYKLIIVLRSILKLVYFLFP
jgi:hypothetical protein